MITHPFLVWLAFNDKANRHIRQVALCAKRTPWPHNVSQTQDSQALLEHMCREVHEEDEHWLRTNFDYVYDQYEIWAAGCWHDWIDERQQWKKPRA